MIAAMSAAVAEIASTRSILRALGERPDHETVDIAKSKIAKIESSESFSDQLEEIALSPESEEKEEREDKQKKASVEREKTMYKAIIQLDEMHAAYQKLLRDAEEKLMRIYDSAVSENEKEAEDEEQVVDEEVVRVLQAGDTIQKVDLSGRKLRILPEAFGKICKLVMLNLSSNQLQV